jgi:hypothetical protein
MGGGIAPLPGGMAACGGWPPCMGGMFAGPGTMAPVFIDGEELTGAEVPGPSLRLVTSIPSAPGFPAYARGAVLWTVAPPETTDLGC